MLPHAKLNFYCSYFSLPSFAGFAAAATKKFSGDSERDACEPRSWERHREGGGSQKPQFCFKSWNRRLEKTSETTKSNHQGERRGKLGFSWCLGAAGFGFGLGHPPNAGLPG